MSQKIILDATISMTFSVTSLKGESVETIIQKLQSGDYVFSLLGDRIYDTTMVGESEGEVATIDDKDLEESDYTFSE